ncbi:50S ribosomal protein L22 [Candidatus Woesearchaeota archaeon]|nr:MAG: 50S ribosomal protein L22 [Candidatus Woesearchaeota archaeon]
MNDQITAKVSGRDLSISRKTGIEICNHLRNRTTKQAKSILEDAIALKRPIPHKRFTNGLGHKRGNLTSGRYSIKACTELLNMIKSAESNAQDKGLNINALKIVHFATQKASTPFHHGRQTRRKTKRSHVDLVVAEMSKDDKKIEAKHEKSGEAESDKKPVIEKKVTVTPIEKTVPEKTVSKEIKKTDAQKKNYEEERARLKKIVEEKRKQKEQEKKLMA